MKLDDFASLVQLGVGLHAGAALFQFMADFASSPMTNRLARLEELAVERAKRDPSAIEIRDQIENLKSDLVVIKTHFESNYRVAVVVNTAIATLLCAILVWISYYPDYSPYAFVFHTITLLSLGPAFGSMFMLSRHWMQNTENIHHEITNVERQLFPRSVSQNKP